MIDTSHFTELNKLDLATKYGAETLDGFSNMNLLESLNVDKAFNVLTASDGQDWEGYTLLRKVDALVDQTHAYLALESSLDSHLPESRVLDRRLQVLSSILLQNVLILLVIKSLVIIVSLQCLLLYVLQSGTWIIPSLKILFLIVLILLVN